METTFGFTLLRRDEIRELNTTAELYRHDKTGAKVLSLCNTDENKVFGIVFRTPPPDSTGLPHILEHAVLSGSRKYPVKEPFVELLKASLNTFLNAMTSPDKTSYPVASQNIKDFYNLIDVYLDAVFHPLISAHTFQQEGWHYELENADDPLTFKGVVFNEMKGAYSSPDNLLYRHSMRSLFPDTPYAFDYGGDPACIPDLTYEQFRAFHQTYYHPSNARIFFYGDDDPAERLRFLSTYLDEFDRVEVAAPVPLQPPFDEPRRLVVPYDAGATPGDMGKRRGFVTVNWLLTESDDPEQTLGLIILDHILIGTPASPLRKALIDSGLGEDLAGGGLDDSLRQMYFSTGLKGIDENDADAVQELVLNTLRDLARDGIDPDTIAASLNTVEFSLRENNTGSLPRGLVLMFRAMSTWLYGGDPLAPLAFEKPLHAIQERITSGERYFENLIQTYFVDNAHRTTVILKPDPDVGAQQEAAEQERLARAREAMDKDQIDAVIADTIELKQRQETPDPPEALATIPVLTLDDLDKQNKEIPAELEDSPAPLLYHDLFTNGILYLDLGFDVHTLPQDLVPYVPLFGQALIKMGTETEDFVRLSQRIGKKTGGLSTTTFASTTSSGEQSAVRLILRAKSTVAQVADLLDIVHDVLLTVRLDNQERFLQMVLETKARKETALVPSGHRVVLTRMGRHLSEAGWVNEQMNGVDSLFFVRQLAEQAERDWPAVLSRLEQVRQALVNRATIICNVTLDRSNWDRVRPQVTEFLTSLPVRPTRAIPWTIEPLSAAEGLTIPARVNYVGKGGNLYKGGYELHGSVSVIANYLRTTWLWEKIRVQGGAYGAFCAFDRHSGQFTYLSYRDPNLLDTLAHYDQTPAFLRNLDLSKDELVKSIIGAIGRIDDYQLPDAKGYTSLLRHLIGDTAETRQRLREQVLGASPADFRRFAKALEYITQRGRVVAMGSEEAIEKANEGQPGWLHVTKVL